MGTPTQTNKHLQVFEVWMSSTKPKAAISCEGLKPQEDHEAATAARSRPLGNHLKKKTNEMVTSVITALSLLFLVIVFLTSLSVFQQEEAWEVQYQEEFLRHLVPLSRNPDDFQDLLECWEYACKQVILFGL